MPSQRQSGGQKSAGADVTARPYLTFLDPIGHSIIHSIELFVSLSTLTSGLSLIAAIICVWTMQVTTRDFGIDTGEERMALVQRIAIALIAVFLVINAITPFITPDPPWLANLPLVVAVGLFMLVFGIAFQRRERHYENRMRDVGLGRTVGKNASAAARKYARKDGAKSEK